VVVYGCVQGLYRERFEYEKLRILAWVEQGGLNVGPSQRTVHLLEFPSSNDGPGFRESPSPTGLEVLPSKIPGKDDDK
jgi:hypothetical protein